MALTDELRPGIWSVPLPIPTGGTVPFSLCYLIEDNGGGVHVLDPGWPSEQNWRALTEAITAIGRRMADVTTITATHLHPDHLGMAERLRGVAEAPIFVHEAEQRAMDLTADSLLRAGELLPIPGRSIEVIHTPGHTTGSICLHDRDERVLFTGDHLLPTVYPGLGLGGPSLSNPVADYLASLAAVAVLDANEAFPGHEHPFTGVPARSAETTEHHLRRSREVAAAIADGAQHTVPEIAATLTWTAGWENLQGLQLRSALAQTAMHVEFVRSSASDPYLR